MGLRYCDGFDHYDTPTEAGWTGGAITTSNPRTGSRGFLPWGPFYLTLDAQATWIVGFAYRPVVSGDYDVVGFYDAGTVQLTLYYNTDRTLSVKRGSTVLGTSVVALTLNAYQYVEFKATIHNSTGAYEVRLNSVNILSGSGADTQNTGNATANQLMANSPFNNYTFDDMYLCDGTGSSNNDFLGDVKVTTLYPSGAGNSTQWTPSAGSNYQCVDESQANGDTDYVSSATATQRDTYAYGDLTGSPTVHAVCLAMHARKDDAGARQIKPVVRHSSTDYDGTAISLATSYANHRQYYDVNPGTSVAWTASDVNGAEFGVKLEA